MSSCIAIVLARGGSKRIPSKNIKLIMGKPMVCWPVSTALTSRIFDDVIISSDDEKIVNQAKAAGASFYGFRPALFSNDFATTAEVLSYEIEQIKQRTGYFPELCCCLYGTSCFVTSFVLNEAVSLIRASPKVDLVMSVVKYRHPIERALHFDDQGLIDFRYPVYSKTRTQDIEPSYHDVGQFYMFRVKSFLKHASEGFAALAKAAVIFPPNSVVDIDDESDWVLAEWILQFNNV